MIGSPSSACSVCGPQPDHQRIDGALTGQSATVLPFLQWGCSAVSQWVPGRTGDLFAAMKQRVEMAGRRIKGCLWYQGESDTGHAAYPHYKGRFSRFAAGLRRLVNEPRLPIITVQLNRVIGARDDGAGWEAMREIQRQLSHELDHVFIIPAFEAGLCDGIHTSSLGNLLIAQRASATALGGVYGHDVYYRHPECISARRVARRIVVLQFDNVVRQLSYECAIENGFPFEVRDRKGAVPVTGYRIQGKHGFRIELGRELEEFATVTGAPGACPPQMIPCDILGYRGMLGFTREVGRGKAEG